MPGRGLRVSKGKTSAALLGLTILAGLLSLATWHGVAPVSPDGCAYMRGATSILSGRGFLAMTGYPQTTLPPGYSLAVALLMRLVPDPELAARLVSLVSSMLTVPLIYALARDFVGVQLGLLSAVLFALLPLRLELSTMVLSESLYLLLLVGAALAMIQSQKGRGIAWISTSGLLCGAAYLVRPEGSLSFVVLGTGVALAAPSWRQTASRLLSCSFCFALLAAPYIAYLHHHTGKWQLTTKTQVNLRVASWIDRGRTWNQMERLDRDGTRVVHPRIASDAGSILTRVMRNEATIIEGALRIVTAGVFLFFPPGLLLLIRSHSQQPVALSVLVVFLLPVAYLAAFFVVPRMLLVPAVAVIVCASAGLKWLGGDSRHTDDSSRIDPKARLLAIVLVCAYCLLLIRPIATAVSAPADRQGKEIGLWTKDNLPRPGAIMAPTPTAAFYAGRDHVLLPYEPVSRVLRYARVKGVELLLLQRGDRRLVHASVDEFVRSPMPMPGLHVIKQWDGAILVSLEGEPES